MPRRPLAAEIAAVRARIAADGRKLALLLEAQRLLIEAVGEEVLHAEQSRNIIPEMQADNVISRGVAIAAGRGGQTASRMAQIAANLTDKQVAALLKVSRSTVCKWHLGTLRIPERAQAALEKRGIGRAAWLKR